MTDRNTPSPPAASAGLRIGVIVVSYNSEDVLDECIASLAASVGAANNVVKPARLVVVDNASAQRPAKPSYDELDATVVLLDANLGFSPAVNLGASHLGECDYLLLLNPDARLLPSTLEDLLRRATSDGAALVGPLLTSPTGTPHGVSERPFHSLSRELLRQLGLQRADPPFGDPSQARCLTGACLLVDRQFFAEVGGLDTFVPMYLEDVELCWQAHEQGRTVVFDPSIHCAHALGGSSGDENFRAKAGLHLLLLAARVEFVRRRRGRAAGAVMRAAIALGAVPRIGIGMVLGRPHLVRKHRAALKWAITNGGAPAWPIQS